MVTIKFTVLIKDNLTQEEHNETLDCPCIGKFLISLSNNNLRRLSESIHISSGSYYNSFIIIKEMINNLDYDIIELKLNSDLLNQNNIHKSWWDRVMNDINKLVDEEKIIYK